MARAVVYYDKDLPEIPHRLPHLPPDSFLRKKAGTDEFEIVEGRRPSKLLLVNKLRQAVGEWRNEGYPGATEISTNDFEKSFGEFLESAEDITRFGSLGNTEQESGTRFKKVSFEK